tara:strand:- start:2126 stop:2251 length:126 start_codon:yes stop_codon:yes gene_type:complete
MVIPATVIAKWRTEAHAILNNRQSGASLRKLAWTTLKRWGV